MAIITRSQSKPVRHVTATDLGWLDPPHYKTYQDQLDEDYLPEDNVKTLYKTYLDLFWIRLSSLR